tara:strand:+ start:816 stop:932 length:117 start_codon:yes stop_codon:yes gene_type:complete
MGIGSGTGYGTGIRMGGNVIFGKCGFGIRAPCPPYEQQ